MVLETCRWTRECFQEAQVYLKLYGNDSGGGRIVNTFLASSSYNDVKRIGASGFAISNFGFGIRETISMEGK